MADHSSNHDYGYKLVAFILYIVNLHIIVITISSPGLCPSSLLVFHKLKFLLHCDVLSYVIYCHYLSNLINSNITKYTVNAKCCHRNTAGLS